MAEKRRFCVMLSAVLATMVIVTGCGSLEDPPWFRNVSPQEKLAVPIIVQKGETLYGIARRYNLPLQDIIALNHLKPPYKLLAGQTLFLPGAGVATKTVSPDSSSKKGLPQSASQRVAPAEPKKPDKPGGKKTTASHLGKPLTWPVSGDIVVRFGPIGEGHRNDGINIAAQQGTPVRAAQSGVVVYAGNELRGFGNLLLIKHEDGWMTAYAHNSELLVQRGANVAQGQVIAKVGMSGNVTRPQLHFEVRQGSKAVDPLLYLEKSPNRR